MPYAHAWEVEQSDMFLYRLAPKQERGTSIAVLTNTSRDSQTARSAPTLAAQLWNRWLVLLGTHRSRGARGRGPAYYPARRRPEFRFVVRGGRPPNPRFPTLDCWSLNGQKRTYATPLETRKQRAETWYQRKRSMTNVVLSITMGECVPDPVGRYDSRS